MHKSGPKTMYKELINPSNTNNHPTIANLKNFLTYHFIFYAFFSWGQVFLDV